MLIKYIALVVLLITQFIIVERLWRQYIEEILKRLRDKDIGPALRKLSLLIAITIGIILYASFAARGILV